MMRGSQRHQSKGQRTGRKPGVFFLSVTPARRYPEALLLYPRTNKKQGFLGGGERRGSARHRAMRLTHTLTPLSQLSSSKAHQSPGALPRDGRKQSGRLGLALCPMITAWHSPHLGWRRHGISDNLIGTPGNQDPFLQLHPLRIFESGLTPPLSFLPTPSVSGNLS